jgi:hypothetical protein
VLAFIVTYLLHLSRYMNAVQTLQHMVMYKMCLLLSHIYRAPLGWLFKARELTVQIKLQENGLYREMINAS